jgi:hypothetical protein
MIGVVDGKGHQPVRVRVDAVVAKKADLVSEIVGLRLDGDELARQRIDELQRAVGPHGLSSVMGGEGDHHESVPGRAGGGEPIDGLEPPLAVAAAAQTRHFCPDMAAS